MLVLPSLRALSRPCLRARAAASLTAASCAARASSRSWPTQPSPAGRPWTCGTTSAWAPSTVSTLGLCRALTLARVLGLLRYPAAAEVISCPSFSLLLLTLSSPSLPAGAPERDEPDVVFSVHFSCLQTAQKPSQYESEHALMEALTKAGGADKHTRYWFLRWYETVRSGTLSPASVLASIVPFHVCRLQDIPCLRFHRPFPAPCSVFFKSCGCSSSVRRRVRALTRPSGQGRPSRQSKA